MDTRQALRSLSIAVMALALAACARLTHRTEPEAGAPAGAQPLRPGDAWQGMTLTSDGGAAASVWNICSFADSGEAIIQSECRVPARPLAIGPNGAHLPEALQQLDWEWLQWSLTLDEQPVDLEAFGLAGLLLPQKAAHGRDALFVFQAWDVVLSAPTPGTYTLRATVSARPEEAEADGVAADAFEWILTLKVE